MSASIDTTAAVHPGDLPATLPPGAPGLLTAAAVVAAAILFLGLLIFSDVLMTAGRRRRHRS